MKKIFYHELSNNIVRIIQTMEIPLRNTYARIQKDRIFSVVRPEYPSTEAEDSAVKALSMELGGAGLFLQSNNMMGYISRTLSRYNCETPISIIVPGLRDIYFSNIQYFPEEAENIRQAVLTPAPYFYDVYDYNTLRGYQPIRNVSEYQLFGTVTVYDVLHIPLKQFVNTINTRRPLQFFLRQDPDIILSLTYNNNDFWDNEYQRPIMYVDIARCKS